MARGQERAWAAVAHFAVLLGAVGLVVSGGLWLYSRRRHFSLTADQAAQAASYQAALSGLMIALGLVGAQTLAGGLVVGALHLAGMAYGAYAAFAALEGHYFRYARGR